MISSSSIDYSLTGVTDFKSDVLMFKGCLFKVFIAFTYSVKSSSFGFDVSLNFGLLSLADLVKFHFGDFFFFLFLLLGIYQGKL